MSFARLERALRSTSGRLTAWYFVVFVASVALVGALDSSFIAQATRAKEREILSAHVAEYKVEVEARGVLGLERAVTAHAEGPSREAVRLRRGGDTLFEREPAGAVPLDAPETSGWRVVATKLDGNLELRVGRSNDAEKEILGRLRDASILALCATLLLGIVGGAVLTRRALAPVRALRAGIESILASGDLSERVATRRPGDELDELAGLFNQMLAKNFALVRGMREALDNVAHDLKTPLARLRASAELAIQEPPEPKRLRDALAESIEQSEQVLVMLRTLMDVSAAEAGVMRLERVPVDLGELVREVADTYEVVAEERGVRLVTHAEPARTDGDAGRLRQLIANLVDNAVKYTPAGGIVEVSTEQAQGGALVRVHDTGMGIATEDLPRIFDRLYRGDRSRSEPGLGLGLSFVKAIADAHEGKVQVTSHVGAGSEFTVLLPDARPPRM